MSSAYWLSQMRGIERTKQYKEQRKRTVDLVNGHLGANYYDNCLNVNQNLTNTCLAIGSAVKKNTTFSNKVSNAVEEFYQSNGSDDKTLSNAISHLTAESSQLARDISKLNDDYRSASNNYYAALRAEEEERQRQAAAAAAARSTNNSTKRA